MSQRLYRNIKLDPKSFAKGIEPELDYEHFKDALKAKLIENDREHITEFLREQDFVEIYQANGGKAPIPVVAPPIELEKEIMVLPITKPTQPQIKQRLLFNKKIIQKEKKIGIKIKGRTKYYTEKNLKYSDFQRKIPDGKTKNAYSIYNKRTKKLLTWRYF